MTIVSKFKHFSSHHNSRVVIYNRRAFVLLTTGPSFLDTVRTYVDTWTAQWSEPLPLIIGAQGFER